MKLGIIREGKVPPDSRVLFTPEQCVALQEKYDIQFVVQPSPGRCLPDEAYRAAGITVQEDIADCEVFMGIKEVPKDQLVANKKYFFSSHTIKAQPYNKTLLQKVLRDNITLFDYEVLTNAKKQRVIAFGRFAGIVGAHNGMMAYGNRTKAFDLEQMHKYDDYAAAIAYYKTLSFPKMKIIVTGTGRVANGAAEVLDYMEIKKVSPQDFLTKEYEEAVYAQLDCVDYAAPKDTNKAFELMDFFKNPMEYKSIFAPYTKVADVLINGIYWANEAPAFFSKEDMKMEDFNIKVIADVTCDIAPVASIPSTLFATTIAKPVFGYDPTTESAVEPYQAHTVDMMTVDNLPNELPKDASKSFGEQFTEHVIEELLGLKDTGMLERAMIASNGQLGPCFQYLTDYVK
ncbi:MAG: alanine dehydrogenase [Aureispira sp.]|nr:alanine dehydrogenase [Aureispira sp.]